MTDETARYILDLLEKERLHLANLPFHGNTDIQEGTWNGIIDKKVNANGTALVDCMKTFNLL